MSKFSDQLVINDSFSAAVPIVPLAPGDNQLVAFEKIQAALFAAGLYNYIGAWDASTNTPTLANGTGAAGDWHSVSVAGTVDFGAGNIAFTTNDAVYYNGSTWNKTNNPDGSAIPLPTGQILIGQDDGLAAPKAMTGQGGIDKNGKFTITFSSSLTNGVFDGTILGGGVQFLNTDQPVAITSMQKGVGYELYNAGTTVVTYTVTGTNAVMIGGDGLTDTVALTQKVNPGTGYTFTLQDDGLTVYIK